MAGYIFSAPSEGKGLVVVNIFFGLMELGLNRAARELHGVSVLYVWCWPGLQVFPQRNMLLTEKSLNAVICSGLCTHVYICVKYR